MGRLRASDSAFIRRASSRNRETELEGILVLLLRFPFRYSLVDVDQLDVLSVWESGRTNDEVLRPGRRGV